MSQAAKLNDIGRVPFRRLSDSETLLFLTRALQAGSASGDAVGIVAKLQALADLLDRQERAVLALPYAPGKAGLSDNLARAKTLLAEITSEVTDRAAGKAVLGAADTERG